jgi:hypothetical protein
MEGAVKEIHDRVFIDNEEDCFTDREGWAVVHACKSPCHQAAVGYRGSLKPEHPHYLVLEQNNDLFLNIIDPPVPLFKLDTFTSFLRFAEKHWNNRFNLLIHCNQGESRAPTLALLLMAKSLGALPSESFLDAKKALLSLYPSYFPGRGIQTFLDQNWQSIR